MAKLFTSLEKGLNILFTFSFDRKELSAQEISKGLNIPLSTTYKYLNLLTKRRFLSKNSNSNKFSLGLMIFKLGNVFNSNLELVDTALPHMRSLAKLLKETVLLTLINGYDAMCLEKIETQSLIKLSLEKGATLPLHAGASSRILLAYQNDSFINAMIKESGLPKLAKNTITDPIKLKKELKKNREHGFVYTDSEADSMAVAIAAPIFNHKKEMVAGLSIAGPRERISTKNTQDLINTVKKHAEMISLDFGYRIDEVSTATGSTVSKV